MEEQGSFFELKNKLLLRKPAVHIANDKISILIKKFYKKKMRLTIKNCFKKHTVSILNNNLLRLAYVRLEPQIGIKNIFKLDICKFVKDSDEFNFKLIDKLIHFMKKYSITNNIYNELTSILNSIFDRNIPTLEMIKSRKRIKF